MNTLTLLPVAAWLLLLTHTFHLLFSFHQLHLLSFPRGKLHVLQTLHPGAGCRNLRIQDTKRYVRATRGIRRRICLLQMCSCRQGRSSVMYHAWTAAGPAAHVSVSSSGVGVGALQDSRVRLGPPRACGVLSNWGYSWRKRHHFIVPEVSEVIRVFTGVDIIYNYNQLPLGERSLLPCRDEGSSPPEKTLSRGCGVHVKHF